MTNVHTISHQELFGDIKIYAIDSQGVVSWIDVGCSRNVSKEVNSKYQRFQHLFMHTRGKAKSCYMRKVKSSLQ
jgi:hypothetical protein